MNPLKPVWARLCATWTLTVALGSLGLQAADYHVIPFDVDPPLVIDADLSDWNGIPNPLNMAGPEQITYSVENWSGPSDLGATARLAWRPGGLYVAVEVTDDHVFQSLTGRDMFKGDHVEVFVDLTPGTEPKRTMFGQGQFQIGLSPGTLGERIGNQILKPEIYVWRPAEALQQGGEIAAKRTAAGYLIEAFVPFSRLRVQTVRMHQDANFEIAISDCDGAPPSQDSMLTVGTEPWTYGRQRLIPVIFGDGNGKGKAPVRSIPVKDVVKIPEASRVDLTVTLEQIPEGKEAFVFFQARLHREKVAGFRSTSLAVEWNGTRVVGSRVSNRPASSMWMSGKESTFVAPDGRLTVPYAPSPEAFDTHAYYALTDNVKGCDFEFLLAGLVEPGPNMLTFVNLIQPEADTDLSITVESVDIRIRPAGLATTAPKPAPTGPLPVYEPRTPASQVYGQVQRGEGTMSVSVGADTFEVTSRFSAPDGQLYPGSSPYVRHAREVTTHGEWIEVRDTFTNTTENDVPVMQSHTCTIEKNRVKDVFLACLKQPSGSGRTSVPSNPTVFATTPTAGIGMLALNDIFRIHIEQTADGNSVTLADRSFVLGAGKTYTSELALVPTEQPDKWAFVNACRRLMDANFTVPTQFAFLSHRQPIYEWSDSLFTNWIERKSIGVLCQSIYFARWKGRLPQGEAFQRLSDKYDYYHDMRARIDKHFPEGSVRHAVYYHCYLDVIDENRTRFADCAKIDASGNHMNYSGRHPYLMLYVPTLRNAWGKTIGKGIDVRLDDLRCNAFYWDEYNSSRGAYTYNMDDGVSADIDPKSYRIERRKAAVHLVSLPFLTHHIRRIMDRGIVFVGNGAPQSRTLANLKFQNFVETGSISNCHRTLLHTPVALGDHLTERSYQDAYNVMLKALDWGCLYNWYSGRIIPRHKTITDHMFPFTPIELHEGWVVGRERILTNRSGIFGWGDKSEFDVFVYDREGKQTDGHEAKTVRRNDNLYAEIRIPEGYSAAIVRK